MSTLRGSGARRRRTLATRAVAATVALARENGLRAEEPAVLADLFSLMMHLRPAPVVAHHRPDLEIVGLESSPGQEADASVPCMLPMPPSHPSTSPNSL